MRIRHNHQTGRQMDKRENSSRFVEVIKSYEPYRHFFGGKWRYPTLIGVPLDAKRKGRVVRLEYRKSLGLDYFDNQKNGASERRSRNALCNEMSLAGWVAENDVEIPEETNWRKVKKLRNKAILQARRKILIDHRANAPY